MTALAKPSATSAGSTAFCCAKVIGPGGHLWIDGNGKITAGNGTLDAPKPNAFSLVQISDCPGATETCKASCYVHGLQKHAPDTHALYRHNSVQLRRILDDPSISYVWACELAEWITENCAGGFRWHVSGDIISARHADWIKHVCAWSPNVRHWIYTRFFKHFFPLLDVSTKHRGGNLAINLSCDKDNYAVAEHYAIKYGLRLCYLTRDGEVPMLFNGDVIFPDYALRGGTEAGADWFDQLSANYKSYVCPVDFHGKSERRRCGPCDRCMK